MVDAITVRQLRNDGGRVLDRVVAGERLVVTRAGRPVAELRPIEGAATSLEAILPVWRRLPRIDLDNLREELDAVIDPSLWP